MAITREKKPSVKSYSWASKDDIVQASKAIYDKSTQLIENKFGSVEVRFGEYLAKNFENRFRGEVESYVKNLLGEEQAARKSFQDFLQKSFDEFVGAGKENLHEAAGELSKHFQEKELLLNGAYETRIKELRNHYSEKELLLEKVFEEKTKKLESDYQKKLEELNKNLSDGEKELDKRMDQIKMTYSRLNAGVDRKIGEVDGF